MPRFGITRKIGQSAAPSGELPNSRGINGQAIIYGSGADTTGGGGNGRVGYHLANDDIEFLNWSFPLPVTEFAGAVIHSARLRFWLVDSIFAAGFPASTILVLLYAIRKALDITDCTWTNYDATGPLAWSAKGGALGTDLVSAQIASIPWTSEQHAADPSSLARVELAPIEVRPEVQWRVDRQHAAMLLQMRPGWTVPAPGNSWLEFDDPVAIPTIPHSYLEVVYTPEFAAFGDDGTGKADLSKFLDYTVVDQDAAIQAGSPQPGGAGPEVSAVFTNTGSNEILRGGKVRQGSVAESVTQPSGGPTLKYVDHLDGDGTGATKGMTGELVLESDPADNNYYTAKFKPFGATVYTALQTSGGSAHGLFNADVTWRHYSATTKNAVTILQRDWSATSAATGKAWRCLLSADQQPADSIEGSEDRFYITFYKGPANYWDTSVAPDRTLSASTRYRQLSKARFEQLWADSHVEDVDGEDRTVLPVRHHANWAAGMQITVFSLDGLTWHHTSIHSVITAGGDPDGDIDSIVCEDKLVDASAVEVTYDTTASVCSGVMPWAGTGKAMGKLSKADRTRFTADAAIGATSFTAEVGFTATTGSIQIYSASGAYETKSFARSGNIFSVPSGLALAHVIGDPVVYVNADWCAPWFTQLRPELGADPMEQKALARLQRWIPR